MQDTLQLVAQFGLPIVLTVWFVFRIDQALTKLISLLEAVIKWQNETDKDRNARDEEIKTVVKDLDKQVTALNNKISVMEVKLDR